MHSIVNSNGDPMVMGSAFCSITWEWVTAHPSFLIVTLIHLPTIAILVLHHYSGSVLGSRPLNLSVNIRYVLVKGLLQFPTLTLWLSSLLQILFFFYMCRTCFYWLLFIYNQHASTLRQTCLFLMFTLFLHYVLHVFASRLTHSFTYLNQ